MQQTPIPNSYWLLPGKLLAGEYPGAKVTTEARPKLRAFLENGVSYFLDLTEEDEGLEPYLPLLQEEAVRLGRTIIHCRLPIQDMNTPSVELMREIQQVIAAALHEGHIVYVHCLGGLGRTGTVAGCYLVEQGMNGEVALAEIARLRQGTLFDCKKSPQNQAQVSFVENWRHSVSLMGNAAPQTERPPQIN